MLTHFLFSLLSCRHDSLSHKCSKITHILRFQLGDCFDGTLTTLSQTENVREFEQVYPAVASVALLSALGRGELHARFRSAYHEYHFAGYFLCDLMVLRAMHAVVVLEGHGSTTEYEQAPAPHMPDLTAMALTSRAENQ